MVCDIKFSIYCLKKPNMIYFIYCLRGELKKMAIDNGEQSQQNVMLKRHGYRWKKERNEWILKDPQGKTTTLEKALHMINKLAVPVPPPRAPRQAAPTLAPSAQQQSVNLTDRPAIIRWAQQVVRRRPLILNIEAARMLTNDEIIEVSVVDVYGHTVFDSLIKPTQPISSMTGNIHTTSANILEQAPTFIEIWPHLYPLLIQNELIIYNAAAQLKILRQTAARHQLALPAIISHCLMLKYALYAGVKVSEREYKMHDLSTACTACNISTESQHALDDADAARQLLLALANLNT
jgi:DNA polymerase-3 subunit epsilon